MYQVFSESVHGYGHQEKGLPCEDYGLKYEDDKYKIFMVADGHGDPNCARSSLGSKLICECAKEKLVEFANIMDKEKLNIELFMEHKVEERIRQLVRSIIASWLSKVQKEYSDNPLREEEKEKIIPEFISAYEKNERIEHLYGTTLIAGLLTNEYLLLLQQGDGHCDVFDADGVVSQPIPWDDRCIGTLTTSVCDYDVVESFRYHVIDIRKNPITACIAASDGLEDSLFSMDMFHAQLRDYQEYACENGMDALCEYLRETLPDFSRNGSGDDITISGFLNVEGILPLVERMHLENDIVKEQYQLVMAEQKLSSMSRKMQYLEEKYSKALLEFDELNETYNQVMEKFNSAISDEHNAKSANLSEDILNTIKNTLKDVQKEKEQIEPEYLAVKAEKDRIESEYLPYKERYSQFEQKKREASANIERIKEEIEKRWPKGIIQDDMSENMDEQDGIMKGQSGE